jgi:multicomponent Na+:H+ antiporter subunit F
MALGPTMLDRVIALDVLAAVLICGLGVEAAVNRHTTTLPVLVVLSLVGFVGSVSMARFTRGSDDVEADRS